jgi:hypothetical protein
LSLPKGGYPTDPDQMSGVRNVPSSLQLIIPLPTTWIDSAAKGMSERQIVLRKALDDSQRSRQIRSRVSADGRALRVFLIGLRACRASSDKPLSAENLFARVEVGSFAVNDPIARKP